MSVSVVASSRFEPESEPNGIWRDFPKRVDKKSWTDRELRLEELEAVSGGTTPAKHQQPHEYVEVQLKEVFIC
jgi:hypothetical protein